MSKTKEPKAVEYGGATILIDTIAVVIATSAGYSPNTTYGIKFLLRSGKELDTFGDSKIFRDRTLAYIKTRIKTITLPTNRCDACATRKIDENGRCVIECTKFSGFPRFVAKEPNEHVQS